MKSVSPASDSSNGFTLVELAIALMVIGLLIGGVLKGQELVENARITATARQLVAIDTAMMIFRNTYDALPGDIKNPAARIPNCTASPCSDAGNGDKKIMFSTADESTGFFVHLLKANLISGMDPDMTTWYQNTPTPFEGCMVVTYGNGALYLQTKNTMAIYACDPDDDGKQLFTPKQTASIDRKLDDGKPGTGDIYSEDEGMGMGNCLTGTDYNEADTQAHCYFTRALPN